MLLKYYYCYESMGVWGIRYFIKVIKECHNIPGFAPETYDKKVGEIVQKFKDPEKEPYFMPANNAPNLIPEELSELARKTKCKFFKKRYL